MFADRQGELVKIIYEQLEEYDAKVRSLVRGIATSSLPVL